MSSRLALCWLLLLLSPLVGCKGCFRSPDSDANLDLKKDADKTKKQRLVADELKTLPFTTDAAGNYVKPGHWYQARNSIKANFGDESLLASIAITDRDEIPIPMERNAAAIEFKRDVSLAVGQEKALDLLLLHPPLSVERTPGDTSEKQKASIRTRFSLRGLGTIVLEELFGTSPMEGYQYDLVVLSRDASRYLFWRGLDCILWRRADELQENRFNPHRVVDITEEEVATHFPSRLATMTSISHVVINDLSLSVMSKEQQTALADWLHFGGTLVINGPEAVAGIENSQLKEWVPIQDTSMGDWPEADQQAFDQNWSVRIAGGERIPFQPDRKIPLLNGTLAPGGQWVPSLEGLVADRLIGQGRVVMTTFPMTDAAFLRWPSYSSFVHNGILRKPHRNPTLGTEASTVYADDYEGTERNPYHNTRLRLWARDLDLSLARSDREVQDKHPVDASASFPKGKSTSLGAWNPASRVVEQATACLRESSGITVPNVGTILRLLIGYLIVLVPVNWFVFRMIGRVEWAWVAAPVIALLGAMIVARSVQLDVGFSRSQTSYGFLECHNGYSRGLLSSYNALYTSLTTNYQAVYPEGQGVVVPIPRAVMRTSVNERAGIDYWMADEQGSGLQRLPVLSNSTGMIQSEEMVALSGPMNWTLDTASGNIQASNQLGLPIRDIGVLGVSDEGKLMTGWIGTAGPGESVDGVLQVANEDERWFSQWDDNPLLKKPNMIRASDGMIWTDEPVEDIYLGPLLMVMATRYPLQRGECIALGWTESIPTQLQVSPTTVQKKEKTLVLMHVRAASLPPVQPDTRIFAPPEEDDN